MACTNNVQTNTTYSFDPDALPLVWTATPDMSSPALVVSNAPETITVAGNDHLFWPANLYKTTIQLPLNQKRAIRIFMWHINGDDAGANLEKKFGLLAKHLIPSEFKSSMRRFNRILYTTTLTWHPQVDV